MTSGLGKARNLGDRRKDFCPAFACSIETFLYFNLMKGWSEEQNMHIMYIRDTYKELMFKKILLLWWDFEILP